MCEARSKKSRTITRYYPTGPVQLRGVSTARVLVWKSCREHTMLHLGYEIRVSARIAARKRPGDRTPLKPCPRDRDPPTKRDATSRHRRSCEHTYRARRTTRRPTTSVPPTRIVIDAVGTLSSGVSNTEVTKGNTKTSLLRRLYPCSIDSQKNSSFSMFGKNVYYFVVKIFTVVVLL